MNFRGTNILRVTTTWADPQHNVHCNRTLCVKKIRLPVRAGIASHIAAPRFLLIGLKIKGNTGGQRSRVYAFENYLNYLDKALPLCER